MFEWFTVPLGYKRPALVRWSSGSVADSVAANIRTFSKPASILVKNAEKIKKAANRSAAFVLVIRIS